MLNMKLFVNKKFTNFCKKQFLANKPYFFFLFLPKIKCLRGYTNIGNIRKNSYSGSV